MMKKLGASMLISLLLVSLLTTGCFISTPAMAMEFSQPVEIGWMASKGGPYGAKNALPTSVPNQYFDFQTAAGIIRFYLADWRNMQFGSPNNTNNTVSVCAPGDIYEITGSNGLTVYILLAHGTSPDYTIYLIGKNKNGRFIKYVGRERFDNILKEWFPDAPYAWLNGYPQYNKNPIITVQGDTISFKCEIYAHTYPKRQAHFSFKWDEAAQWFGIDYQLLD